MKTYTTFQDIEPYTKDANYSVNVPVYDINRTIEYFQERNQLELNPDFQRGHVWNTDKKIAFVEHTLRGGKGAEIIRFNCVGWMRTYKGPFVLVDGLQRITALTDFLNNKIPVFGTLYKDYKDKLPHKLTMIFAINDLPTRADVLQWYIQLNDGGVVHSSEEISRVQYLLELELINNPIQD